MTPDAVEQLLRDSYSDAKIRRNDGTLSFRNFTTGNLLFGFNVSIPDTSGVGEQTFVFTFDVTNGDKLINIRRQMFFNEDNAPDVDSFIASLIGKYGKPVISPTDSSTFFWFVDADSSLFHPGFPFGCAAEVREYGLGLIQAAGNFQEPSKDDMKCGTWMAVKFDTFRNNDRLVQAFNLGYGNVPALARESINIVKFVREQEAKHNASNPNNNKPQI
jgi:hypothetical protein